MGLHGRGRLMAHCVFPAPERCGLRSVDHRLRLFLDVEVFTDAQEEFQCCIKVCASLGLPLPPAERAPARPITANGVLSCCSGTAGSGFLFGFSSYLLRVCGHGP